MNHSNIARILGSEYAAISERVGYLSSPLTIPGDGTTIGAYLIDTGAGRLRITDDAELLFTAMTHGVTPSRPHTKAASAIARQCGVEMTDRGELSVECALESAAYYVARFLDAATRIAHVSMGARPKPTDGFELKIAGILSQAFAERVKRNVAVFGASGHLLRFPFALDDRRGPLLIQTVPAKDGHADWSSVYQALGKLTDVKNNPALGYRRLALLEPVPDQPTSQATVALADAASVMVFRDSEELIRRLAA